ncbi:MAG: AMP-binding protein [Oscillospiraceae bacterium]|nr:AMP-binding protein [Oscillospiraceae bacterium]
MENYTVENWHEQFVTEEYDENGILTKFQINAPENFNFGYDIIDKFAELEPNRRALLWVDLEDNEKLLTFGNLSRLSNKAANMFLNAGIKKGDCVMLTLKRHYQFWYILSALNKIGAIAIPASALLTAKDFQYRFKAADVKAIVSTHSGEVPLFIEEAEKNTDHKILNFIVNGSRDGWVNFDEEIEKFPDTLERIPTKSDELMLMYFTSGTTGHPKMAVHDHKMALAHIQNAKHWQKVDPNGIHLTISDTGWAKAAWGKIFGQLTMGTCIFVYDFDKFVPANMLKMIEKYKITTLCAPPTMFRFFIAEGIEKYDLSSVTYCNIAGEALQPEVFNKWYEATGIKLMEGFGQSESTCIIGNLIGTTPKPGSMGKPMPLYNVDLVDDEGNSVPPGVVGEIVIKGEYCNTPGLFRGYYNSPEPTDKAWHDGWYHTGDTATRDEDGYYWYVGRNDDVIKSSGYRIGPFEVESVLSAHPAVLECAVTGAPHPIRGEVVKATIILTNEYKDKAGEELIKEIQTFVKRNTAPYKYPRIVEFVDELPKTVSGKIRRTEIRKNDFENAKK